MALNGSTNSFLSNYLERQLLNNFPDNQEIEKEHLNSAILDATKWLKLSFSYLNSKYYRGEFSENFNYLNSDHYAMFLYCVSRKLFEKEGDCILATKIFLLNKALHGIDAFYRVKLPEVFLFVHPIGTVLGRANYADFFCVYQNCTIGSKEVDKYPTIGRNVTLFSGVSLIGNCIVGENVAFGANTTLISKSIPNNSIVLGRFPNNRILPLLEKPVNQIFNLKSLKLKMENNKGI